MVWTRFSAWSKTTDAGDSKTSSVASIASMPNFRKMSSPIFVCAVVERREAVEELRLRVPRRGHEGGVDLVRQEELDPLGPDGVGLAHRDPDVGVDEVDAARRRPSGPRSA